MCAYDDWSKSKHKNSKITKQKSKIKKDKSEKILNDPWIEHFFALQYDFSKNFKDKNLETINSQKFKNQLDNLVYMWQDKLLSISDPPYDEYKNYVIIDNLEESEKLSRILKSTSLKLYLVDALPHEYFIILKPQAISEWTYYLLIRFPSITKSESKRGFFDGAFGKSLNREIPSTEKVNYKFSPLQTINFFNIAQAIEKRITIVSNGYLTPQEFAILIIERKDKEIIIYESNGLYYFYYLLNKRAELYSKFPEIEKKIFKTSFPKFANGIINKKKESDEFKFFAEKIKIIIKKYNIKI